ncbi:Spo11/DNA topoisomerase VI subunit A [Xylogone sp. PMI_703]|nr:Spo11/DNA topoisomerase VI subunit A [Xylogone sp. PMI_703]
MEGCFSSREMLTNNQLNRIDSQDLAVDHPNSQPTVVMPIRAGEAISKIEDIFESIADSINDGKRPLAIHLKSRPRGTREVSDVINARKINFPSKSPQEAWRFTVLLRILELSHEALVTGIVITKRFASLILHYSRHDFLHDIFFCSLFSSKIRDIYYHDPDLFMKQSVVDRYVDDLSFTLGINRDALNVVAAAKGLVAGYLTLIKIDRSSLECALENEGILIPSTKNIERIHCSEVRWILVIEKEAVFRSLTSSQYWACSAAGKGILVTAKGYPDIQTRQFLRFLSAQQPEIPIFALVDFDPDGIGIMSTYKYGSIALAHENQTLAVPEMRWLGIKNQHIMSTSDIERGIISLTTRDRRVATSMLARDPFSVGGEEKEGRRELQVMLFLNIKAEIQALNHGEGLESWLDRHLCVV